MLYRLHGSGGLDTSESRFVQRNVEQITAAWPVIVVMPDAGEAGWYNDWTSSPIARKMANLLSRSVDCLDRSTPTDDRRSCAPRHRGFAAGGYGAIHLAGARPDLFGQAISLSGLLDFHPAVSRIGIQEDSSLVVGLPDAIFGNGTNTSEAQWAKPDPIESINKLADTYLQILVGSGAHAVSERTWVWQLMKVHAGANNPGSWNSVADDVRDDLIERLPIFVADYNRLYVTKPSQLVPRCWPLHPALAREVAVLYATWLASFHEDTGAAHNGAYWFDRWLPGFQGRIQDWLGKEPDACRAGLHPDNWNDVAGDGGCGFHRFDAVLRRDAEQADHVGVGGDVVRHPVA
ncbi:MAG: alpha/beta hydrolase-fold protein, partial [Antricoccus sp.]